MLSTIAALIACVSYAIAVNRQDDSYRRFGNKLFLVHAVSVVLIFFSLFFIIHSHYFEYQYAYQHSSTELPVYYMISCFWEGQEGSFLLWMFWHAFLGVIMMRRVDQWQAPVLAVISLAQVILGSMLLGFEIGDLKIGSSPFILMREHNPESLLIPVLEKLGKANYLQVYKDGNGLNPLLQNYWMVIHPPTLFFGFAATIVPFAYAFAGLWMGKIKEWMVPALPWALISVLVLGTGIIMGGYWAYESLNFGGYWAWDPVENASLMPWLLMITATHMLLINKSTGKYPVLTITLVIFSFFMVLYATFLTRSGVLGNASVHSFTDLGLSGQLLLLLFFFIFLTYAVSFKGKRNAWLFFFVGFALIMANVFMVAVAGAVFNYVGTALLLIATVWFIRNLFKLYGTNLETDKFYSREFWMFVGSMVLLLSGFQIIIMTSIPVFNKLYGLSKAPEGPDYYNRIQLWFALGVLILTAVGQYFKYKQSDTKRVFESISNSLLIAVVLSVGAIFLFDIWETKYLIVLIASVYAIVGNLHYLFTALKGKIKVAGGSIAHVGFGLMMVGILVSSVKKNVLSQNNTGSTIFSEVNASGSTDTVARKQNRENLMMVKNRPVMMDGNRLQATFISAEERKPNKYFKVDYQVLDKEGKPVDHFTLYPNSQNNPKMGLISNPDTRHFLTRDIFTHITFESSMENRDNSEFSNFKTDTIKIGESFPTADGNVQLTLRKVNVKSEPRNTARIHLEAEVVVSNLGDTFIARPEFIQEELVRIKESVIDQAGVMVVFDGVLTDSNTDNFRFIMSTGTRRPNMQYIVMKAIEFPYINLLWLGTFVLIFGFVLSIIQRFKEYRRVAERS